MSLFSFRKLPAIYSKNTTSGLIYLPAIPPQFMSSLVLSNNNSLEGGKGISEPCEEPVNFSIIYISKIA